MRKTASTASTCSKKFRHAFRGLRIGSKGQNSFLVHLPVACFVLAAAIQLQCSPLEWCILVLCIAMVIGAELFNTALEHLAKAVTSEYNPHIRDALDIASAAVLAMSLGAAVIGTLVLGFRIGVYLGWRTITVIGW